MLHVVVFNVPWPPNYGGVIDAWYRLKALAAAGLRMQIHVFAYGRSRSAELEKLGSVTYYPRRHPVTALLSGEPYIVSSRASVNLLNNLLKDDLPIFFDGLHTAHFLADPQLATRRKVLRMHNIEWQYYRGLAGMERSFAREWYYREESRRLRRYEQIVQHADAIACISPADTIYYQKIAAEKALYLPAFHPFEQMDLPEGTGKYALYHGNLSVPENVQAASFLIRLWENMPLPLVIAGMDPDYKLYELLGDRSDVQLLADPQEAEMDRLVREAQLHVLPAFQQSGIKLKLLRALFQGRHVIVSPDMVLGTGLEAYCTVAEGEEAFRQKVGICRDTPLSSADRLRRQELLRLFDNRRNAELLMKSLFAPHLL